ncbi:MAG: leucyl/phenylalanyl-tRNA--protein transferase [Sphingomonas sp.]|nr:MAG: leucyl/phenylalanyl-tRNA--protein transferase [Sphingomonas sp.]
MGTLTGRPGGGQKQRLETALLLRAYSAGLFPMADTREAADVFWVEPRRRGILPLGGFHLSRSLAKVLKQERFLHTRDVAFGAVIRACAEAAPGREQSWINGSILDAYSRLHAEGHAHSIETWDRDGRLVGGLYGVRLGAAFFGESMFSRATDASKAALAHLVARLRLGGFQLLDTQFLTAHLARFGAMEVKRAQYLSMLDQAVIRPADWALMDREGGQASGVVAGAGVAGAAGASGFAGAGFAAEPLFFPLELPVELLGALGPSGKRIVQLLSQTS